MAAASSQNEGGGRFFEISKTTKDQDGTCTEKTWARNETDWKKSSKANSKESAAQKDRDTNGEQGVFAKAGSAFAVAGGAVASVTGGKAVASAK
jgi:hypothetical protein